MRADNSKDICHKAQSDENFFFKNSETLQFSHVLSLGVHIVELTMVFVVISLALRLGQEKADISTQSCAADAA